MERLTQVPVQEIHTNGHLQPEADGPDVEPLRMVTIDDINRVCRYSPEEGEQTVTGLPRIRELVNGAKTPLDISIEAILSARKTIDKAGNVEPETGMGKYEYRAAQALLNAAPHLTEGQKEKVINGGNIHFALGF